MVAHVERLIETAQGSHVKGEEDRSKDAALGDPRGQVSRGGDAVLHFDLLDSPMEI